MDPRLAALDDANPSSSSVSGEATMPAQAEVDDFLRKKRKAREYKACYPCRQRKVKCDLSRPCHTCRERDHPELCSYHPPNKRQSVDPYPNAIAIKPDEDEAAHVVLGRGEFELLCRKLNGLEQSIAELKSEIRRHRGETDDNGDDDDDDDDDIASSADGLARRQNHYDVHGLHTKNESGEIVHVGGGSVPAMLYALSQGQAPTGQEQAQLQEFLGKSVLPLFGLDNESATYPFVDLWGLPHGSLQRASELAKALPGDAQMLSLFRNYQTLGHVIYPGIADLDLLSDDIHAFLLARSAAVAADPEEGGGGGGGAGGVTDNSVYGKSFYWLGMLFAVLANGAQCSASTRNERELTSQVYVCCGFECLRFTNFLSQPHIESIQALLLMGNVMTNNMNAGTAWSLLGLTIRLAQGLGLHQECPPQMPSNVVMPRSKVWWAIIWQDSLLSITYDRNAALDVSTMPMPQHYGPVGAYHAAMYRLCRVGLDIVRDRGTAGGGVSGRERIARVHQHREQIAHIMRDASEHLRNSRACSSSRDLLEHWALYLHTSYALSELCRPALSARDRAGTGGDFARAFRSVCVESLANVVDAFLGLNAITFFAPQSWAALHRALGSALLLGIIAEHTSNSRARSLIARLVALLTDITSSVDPSEISAPIQRGVNALRTLHLDDPPASASTSPSTATTAAGMTTAAAADAFSPPDPPPSQANLNLPFPPPPVQLSSHPNQQLQHHQPFFNSPTSNPDVADDYDSPYSVLNNILWGSNSNGSAAPLTFDAGGPASSLHAPRQQM